MNYKLAKELKEAGFPQEGGEMWQPDSESEFVVLPTLSELIEACGKEFYSLTKNPFSPNLWDASRIKDSKGAYRTLLAHTPKEAVAKLWLALNKK